MQMYLAMKDDSDYEQLEWSSVAVSELGSPVQHRSSRWDEKCCSHIKIDSGDERMGGLGSNVFFLQYMFEIIHLGSSTSTLHDVILILNLKKVYGAFLDRGG